MFTEFYPTVIQWGLPLWGFHRCPPSLPLGPYDCMWYLTSDCLWLSIDVCWYVVRILAKCDAFENLRQGGHNSKWNAYCKPSMTAYIIVGSADDTVWDCEIFPDLNN